MTDQDVRDLLARMATEEPIPFFDAAPLTRRARHRAARTVVVGAVGLAAAITVLFAGVAETRTASVPVDQPTPLVTPPPTPFTERFDSRLNGLSIGYPSGWRTRAATEPWGHDALAFDAPDVDVIFDPTFRNDLYLAVVSEPLGSKSPKDWVYETLMGSDSSLGICQVGGGGGAGVPFQGNFAWFEECLEPHGASGGFVMFATATRGYVIYAHVGDERAERLLNATFEGKFPQGWFERGVLKTVVLPGLDSARSPRLVLVREPDQLGVERADQQLAFGVRLIEFAEPHRHVAADDEGTLTRLDDDHLRAARVARRRDEPEPG